ncbi:Tyrosine-protein kinase BTK [Balamuthia mandrillaris]
MSWAPNLGLPYGEKSNYGQSPYASGPAPYGSNYGGSQSGPATDYVAFPSMSSIGSALPSMTSVAGTTYDLGGHYAAPPSLASPPTSQGHGIGGGHYAAPPVGLDHYAQPPVMHGDYAAPPLSGGSPYAMPPPSSNYASAPSSNYGAPPPSAAYGVPPSFSNYASLPAGDPSSGYAAPPLGVGSGPPSGGSPYTAPPSSHYATSSDYSSSPSAAYGAPPQASYGYASYDSSSSSASPSAPSSSNSGGGRASSAPSAAYGAPPSDYADPYSSAPQSGSGKSSAGTTNTGENKGTEEKGKDKSGSGKLKRKGLKWEIDYNELVMEKEIGRGAFGTVFKGKWRNTQVAIKTIRQDVSYLSAKELDEFKSEAKLMMNMRPHANLVQLFGVCTKPFNPLVIVLEFLEGGSLYNLLHSDKELDLKLALSIARETAAGMHHLHTEDICHRDLAARNLLITSHNPEFCHVKITDFGMSRFADTDSDNFTKNKTGPLKWMPPESMQHQKYNAKTDVWSFGVVLWEIFARRDPYPNVSPVQVAIEVASKGMRLRPPTGCPQQIAQLMMRCWSVDPNARPSFDEICRILEDFSKTQPLNYSITANHNEQATFYPQPDAYTMSRSQTLPQIRRSASPPPAAHGGAGYGAQTISHQPQRGSGIVRGNTSSNFP